MLPRLSRLLTCSTLLGVMLLYGCGSAPALISKNAAVPVGLDLSGFWQVRNDPEARHMSADGINTEPLIPTMRKHRGRHQEKSGGSSVQVFLEFGESLKITQTYFGLFISYDRSVVEEYTYGENRLVNIGPIEAERVSGWEGRSFVVQTRDDTGTTLFESWHLDKEGSVLVRDIRVSKGEKDSFVHQQVFDRR